MNSLLILAFIALVIFLISFIYIALKSRKIDSSPIDFPYIKLEALFTPAERSFFGLLKQMYGNEYEILGKVRVADVMTPIKDMTRGEWQRAFNKISAKHFDFLLCSKSDLSVICAIELNDSSHNSKKRKERDAFLESACTAADLPLVQIKAQKAYTISDIKNSISPYLHFKSQSIPSFNDIEQLIKSNLQSDDRLCQKCGFTMSVKASKKGKNIGNEFWACSAFPKCRYIEDISTENEESLLKVISE